MTTNKTYTFSPPSFELFLDISNVNVEQARNALRTITIEMENPENQDRTIAETKNSFYTYIGTAISNSKQEEHMYKLSDSNSDLQLVLDTLTSANIFHKYAINTIYTFYNDKQIWCISDNTTSESLSAFNQEVIGLLYDNHLDLSTMIFLISKNDISHDDIPHFDDKLEV